MKSTIINYENRSFLMKKLLTICPVCKKPIYGRDIDILSLINSKIDHWPVNYAYCHAYNNYPLHSLTIYLDSNFSVRGHEISDFVIVEK